MSILDDAIREHLELKRAHGADDSEVKRLEDEAFGPPQRPDQADPFAEAPTEFLVSPGETPADESEIGDEAERSGRRPNITDLQEPPPAEAPAPAEEAAPAAFEEELSPAPDAPPPSPADAADAPLPPPADAVPAGDLAPPAEEEHPAAEHEIVADSGPDTDERHVIADQPTQMFDVQAEMDAEAPAVPAEPSPTDEQPPLESRGPDAEIAGHPPAEAEPEEESAEYDFFNEQRLSDELDQALEAPLPSTDEHALPTYEAATPAPEPASQDTGGIFDFESDRPVYEEDPSEEVLRNAPAPEPPSEEAPLPPAPEPPSEEAPHAAAEPPSEEADTDFDPDTGHEDVLEDTPKFLEDAPEDDDLWFEQKPPKDFDLD
jgi:hypothetical protein